MYGASIGDIEHGLNFYIYFRQSKFIKDGIYNGYIANGLLNVIFISNDRSQLVGGILLNISIYFRRRLGMMSPEKSQPVIGRERRSQWGIAYGFLDSNFVKYWGSRRGHHEWSSRC